MPPVIASVEVPYDVKEEGTMVVRGWSFLESFSDDTL